MFNFIFRFIKGFNKNDVIGTAAQTAFFLTLSIPPLLVLALSISTNIIFAETVLSMLEFVFPPNISSVFVNVLTTLPKSSGITFVSAIGLIFSASGSVWALMRGIHKASTHEKLKYSIRDRLLALLFTALFTIAVTVSLGSIIVGSVLKALFDTISGYSLLYTVSKRIVSGASIYVFIHFIYRFTPGVALKGRQLFWGAMFSALGWLLVSTLFGIYISYFTRYTTVYGGISAFFILILWLYVISLIILTGAQINGTLAEIRRSRHNYL